MIPSRKRNVKTAGEKAGLRRNRAQSRGEKD